MRSIAWMMGALVCFLIIGVGWWGYVSLLNNHTVTKKCDKIYS